MDTRIDSNDPRWPGYVIIPPYLNYQDLIRWETALDKAKTVSENDTKSSSAFFVELLPVAISIIQEWHIEGLPEKVTADNFPASTRLLAFTTGIVSDLYSATNESDPKVPEKS